MQCPSRHGVGGQDGPGLVGELAGADDVHGAAAGLKQLQPSEGLLRPRVAPRLVAVVPMDGPYRRGVGGDGEDSGQCDCEVVACFDRLPVALDRAPVQQQVRPFHRPSARAPVMTSPSNNGLRRSTRSSRSR